MKSLAIIPDKFHEECGVVGVFNHPEAANLAYLALYALQHRGQEGAGVVSLSGSATPPFHVHKGYGLVSDIFGGFDFAKLPGNVALAHNRYSTAGDGSLANVQPLVAEIAHGPVALAHNGNLINAASLRRELTGDGAIFSSNSDTEAVLHLMARVKPGTPKAEVVIQALQHVQGAYSLVIVFGDRLYAVRDPKGFRPLALAKIGDGYMVASETCAFDLVDATYLRDVEPGEVVEFIPGAEPKSYFPFGLVRESPCIFEYIYFARPDSNVFGQNVYPIRKRLGAELAREFPVKGAEVVVPVPDSGVPAAMGYAEEARVPLELGLIRNHYVGRTFIEPKQSIRDFGVKIKLNANSEVLKGKVVVLVDDSIVRGTTCRKLVKMVRMAGAKEVHMRISAPPTTDPCYYGIDTPVKSDLIASENTVEKIREFIGADSLAYQSLEAMYRAVNSERGKFCDACFTGQYPVGTPTENDREQLRLL